MRIANENLISAPVDMSADFTLRPLWLGHICNYAIQLVFTGSPVGTFKLQASDDPGQPDGASNSNQAIGVSNWTDVMDSSQGIAAAGNHMWTVQNAGYTWVRVVYTAASGSGSLTSARGNVKGV